MKREEKEKRKVTNTVGLGLGLGLGLVGGSQNGKLGLMGIKIYQQVGLYINNKYLRFFWVNTKSREATVGGV